MISKQHLEHLRAINSEPLFAESDRGCVLVACSMLDDRLKHYLSTMFRVNNASPKVIAEIFDGFNPLASFSSKIKVCHCFGLVDGSVYRDLEVIRRIRNSVAHSQGKFDFGKKNIVTTVESLDCVRVYLTEKKFTRYSPSKKEELELPDEVFRMQGFVKYAKTLFVLGCVSIEQYLLASELHVVKRSRRKG